MIFGVAYYLLALVFGDLGTDGDTANWVADLPAVASIACGLFVVGYFVLLEGYLGQTLGRMATGIRSSPRPPAMAARTQHQQAHVGTGDAEGTCAAPEHDSQPIAARLTTERVWHQLSGGATDEEIARPLPGHDLIASSRWGRPSSSDSKSGRSHQRYCMSAFRLILRVVFWVILGVVLVVASFWVYAIVTGGRNF